MDFGFSYVGLIFLLMLFVPNIIWIKNKPDSYSPDSENRVLSAFEKIGQVGVTFTCLCFKDFNIRRYTAWSWWLIAAFFLMLLYELWWIRYFRSEKKIKDFYKSFLFVPLPGAVLPVLAFLFLGVYGKNLVLIVFTLVLAVGHIGIHAGHYKQGKDY